MSKFYCSLGLMSGTSADGVDASVIQSDGDTEYKVILDKYFKYSQSIYEKIHNLKEEINNSKDLKNLSEKIQPLEKEITIFHANAVNEIIKNSRLNIHLLGFHGQTIFHNAKEKISKQLGDGMLLSQITKNLANNKISIQRLIQIPNNKNKTASIVIITHATKQINSDRCLRSLQKNKNVIKKPVLLRLF